MQLLYSITAYQPPIYFFEFPDDLDYRWRVHPARYGRWLLKILGGLDPMARDNGRRNGRFESVEFITINLDAAAEKHFRTYAKDVGDKVVSELALFIAEEHKIGISWDINNNCFIASATCKDEKSENHNLCITARSDDWFEALLLLLYKAKVVANGQPWHNVSRPATWG